jgi:hypothetical protein
VVEFESHPASPGDCSLSTGDWADIRGDCGIPEQKQGQGQDVSGGCSGIPEDCSLSPEDFAAHGD